jgi:DAK2 domain fusion protein YloV
MTTSENSLYETSQHENMRTYPIDGHLLKKLTEASLTWLRTNQQTVNALNVFPVPDGDTGTNMVLTMQAAFDEIAQYHDSNVGKMAHAIAHGSLMGARGNSGVILSQIWRGFARALDHIETIDAASLVRAFAMARDTAYKGVVRPVEGTILTVAKDLAAAAEEALQETEDPFTILERAVAAADQSVARTPDLLPVLKEAGVVDSGGKGLFFILEGMLRYIDRLPLDVSTLAVQPLAAMKLVETMETVELGQDYEVIVDFRPKEPLILEKFYNDLEQLGTSIQVGEGDGIYRLHIHVPTENRYEPIEYTMSLGTITKVSIENLIDQMESLEKNSKDNISFPPVEPGQIAVVAVSPGLGIGRVFASLGVNAIVEGGQSMNPSTQEILRAFENLPTDKVIILPNNKNVILSAEATSHLTVKKLAVVPTRTVPQGLSAMLRLIPHGDFESVVEDMKAAINDVITGEITTATRTVEIDGVDVNEGQIIALLNGKLVLSSLDVQEACLRLLEKAEADHYELITLFYGNSMEEAEVQKIADAIRDAYPDLEVEIQEGGQPHYHFIMSIE